MMLGILMFLLRFFSFKLGRHICHFDKVPVIMPILELTETIFPQFGDSNSDPQEFELYATPPGEDDRTFAALPRRRPHQQPLGHLATAARQRHHHGHHGGWTARRRGGGRKV